VPAEPRRPPAERALQNARGRADAVHVTRFRTSLPSATLPITAAGGLRVAAVVMAALVVAGVSATALVLIDTTARPAAARSSPA
jgi:hypothetical protein